MRVCARGEIGSAEAREETCQRRPQPTRGARLAARLLLLYVCKKKKKKNEGRSFFFQPHTDLYYTRANTYTRQTKYRYTLETYREDRCTHQLTQKTLHKRKITMRSQRSFVLSTSTFCCCLRRPPLLARPTPEQGSHSKDTKVGRSTIARML